MMSACGRCRGSTRPWRSREGREVLHRGLVAGRRADHDGVVHRARLLELGHDRLHGALLLADGDVDAEHVAALLVDDRVDADGGLARLAVADDQLALAAADGDHRVDGLDAGLQRLAHRLALEHRGRGALDQAPLGGLHRALAVLRVAQGVDHAAEHPVAHRHRDDGPGGLHLVAFLDLLVAAEEDHAHVVLLEVQRQAAHAAGELQQLAHHAVVEAVHAARRRRPPGSRCRRSPS
jgi:hypothetical protein